MFVIRFALEMVWQLVVMSVDCEEQSDLSVRLLMREPMAICRELMVAELTEAPTA
jgi:hypothetical protein